MISLPFLKKWRLKESVALDWGSKEMKWAQLKPYGEDRLALTYLDCLPLPKEEGELPTKLKEYVFSHELTHHGVAVSFQNSDLHIRRLELPRMPKEDLVEAIRWQMRDIAEESLEDYTVQYSIIEEKVLTDMVRLVLLSFAIKKETVEKKLALLEKAGLHPFFAEPTAVALATTLERIYPTTEGEWVGCADLGPRHPYFIVLGGGRLHFIHPISGLSEAPISSEEYASKLSVELQQVLDTFFITYRTEKIARIFLAGEGASQKNLGPLLSTNLGIPAELLNPFQKLDGVASFALAKESPYLFGPVLAEALLKP